MINTQIIASVFKNHGIEKIILIPSENKNVFLIQEMSSDISLNRWEHLENVLKDICQKDCDIMSFEYATKYISITKGAIEIK